MLQGHAQAWAEWEAAIASGRMHHAWLLAGMRGLGKGSFAREAAAALVAAGDGPQPSAETHPDILILDHLPANDEEEKKRADGKPHQLKRNITVDQIRRMQQRLTTRPTLGPRRAVIIDPADDMEKGAVNALLKSLEEPPAGTFFLLVAHRPGRLLPTVRSRCRTLRFAPLSNADVDTIVAGADPGASSSARAAAVVAAEGSPGEALAFMGDDLGGLYTLMQRLIREGDESFTLRGALAAEIGARPDRQRQAATLELARAVLAHELSGQNRHRDSKIIAAYGEIARLAVQAPTYNFDPGLLVMEIGGLLASAAADRDRPDQQS